VAGLLLCGVVFGPHGVNIAGEQHPVTDFLAELGKLLLMFFAGLEIDMDLFRRVRRRSVTFGIVTTGVPLILGTVVGAGFGYGLLTSIVIGSLLASHTLLAAPIVMRLGVTRLEPVTITVGATVMSDTLSLIVFAICLSTFKGGFSTTQLLLQLAEIAVFIPLIVFGLSRLGGYALRRVEKDEDAYFILMLAMVAVAALLADVIDLPDIVGAFLAGLSVNAAVKEKPAKEKLEFFGNSFFIPIFFITTGFLIDPSRFVASIGAHFALATSIILALIVGKGIAALAVGRAYGYSRVARVTMWSLTLPQVAATLAATLLAYKTSDPAGRKLLDENMLNVVLVLMVITSILGPVLTEQFAPRLRAESLQPATGSHHPA
jgi:Kef-type K+ transport system membrane component KefB